MEASCEQVKGADGQFGESEGFQQPYTKDDDLIVSNHPMIIMAEENRRVKP
jgi:hypothetical protein